MNTPITYTPGFMTDERAFGRLDRLWRELAWVRHDKVPRREYYVGAEPYAYGKGAGQRTYYPQALHPCVEAVWIEAERAAGCKFDVCFLNGYDDGSDFLGWHADDSPEMDDARPIAIVSLGEEREIWFRQNPAPNFFPETEKLLLQNGSLCLMHPGMQDTHQHRIPKAGRICGSRISFTFRGYVKP